MFKRYLTFNLLFLFVIIVHLFGAIYNMELLKLSTQLLLIISLIILFVRETRLKGRFHKRLLIGLCLALVGGTLLMLPSQNSIYATYGSVAILLCQLFYISAFYLDFRSAPELDKKTARIALFICALASTSFFFYLRPHLGSMRIPVLMFTLIVSFMVLMAIFRNLRVNKLSFNLILRGTILFMLSDATIAINHFIVKIDHAALYITISYLLAQYLIIFGGIYRKLIAAE